MPPGPGLGPADWRLLVPVDPLRHQALIAEAFIRYSATLACVLGGGLKRNIILSLAEAGLFRPHWSERILDETEKAILAISKGSANSVRQRQAIERAFPEAIVHASTNVGLSGLLPDPDDEHVLAAAIAARCDTLVIFGCAPSLGVTILDKLEAGDAVTAAAIGLSPAMLAARPPGPIDAATQAMLAPMIERLAFVQSMNEAWAVVSLITLASTLALCFVRPFESGRMHATEGDATSAASCQEL